VPGNDYIALSRRSVSPPGYVITRSSRFMEHYNPFKHRDRLPKLEGGILGEIAHANGPVMIDNLPKRLQGASSGWIPCCASADPSPPRAPSRGFVRW
jgi:sigma-B regulation protein RsbU (phosphoserine phosphatase)